MAMLLLGLLLAAVVGCGVVALLMESRRVTLALRPRPALNFPRRPASLSDR